MSTNNKLKEINFSLFRSLLSGNIKNICIVDPPIHANVGDSAIFLGEVDLIRSILPNANLWFTDYLYYSKKCQEKIEETDLLIFHGGGNFGDIWPEHHRFRLRIMQDFPEIPKIQCPQSISFSSEKNLQETANVIKTQKNYHLLVRDHKSIRIAKHAFDCPIELCPDMAFSMHSVDAVKPQVDVAMIRRTDKESISDAWPKILSELARRELHFVERDWIAQESGLARNVDARLSSRRAGPTTAFPGFYALLFRARLEHARRRVRLGTRFLSSGRAVVTDRLHGMILANIVERPNFVLDSLDGKISAFFETWLDQDSFSRLVACGEQLVSCVEDVLAK